MFKKFELIKNKTGLEPVSRPEEQVSLHRGLGVGAKGHWCQGYTTRPIGNQKGLVVGGCKVP